MQNLRKQRDYDVADRIKLYYETENNDFEKVIKDYGDMIKDETLSLEITREKNLKEEFDLNGIIVNIDIQKK